MKNPTELSEKKPGAFVENNPLATNPGAMYVLRNMSYSSKAPPNEISSTSRHRDRVKGSRSSRAAIVPSVLTDFAPAGIPLLDIGLVYVIANRLRYSIAHLLSANSPRARLEDVWRAIAI